MIRTKSKLLAILLSICMMVAYMPSVAFAENEVTAETIETNVKEVGDIDFSRVTKNITDIHLHWSKPKNVDGYVIYKSTLKNGDYKRVAKITDEDITEYIDKSLEPNTHYYYKIRAYACTNINGENEYDSDYSPAHRYTTNNIKQEGSVDFSHVAKDKTSIHLKWNKPENTDGYVIYKAESKHGKYKRVIKITNEDTTEYIDTGLKANKHYYYKVRAYACTNVNGKNKYDSDYSPVHRYTTTKKAASVFNGNVEGKITEEGSSAGILNTTDQGVVSGSLSFQGGIVNIKGKVTETGELTTFEGTVNGAIQGDIKASINYNGIATLSGIITNTGAIEAVRIIGTFPESNVDDNFEGEIITGSVPTYIKNMEIKSVDDETTVESGKTLQLNISTTPAKASKNVLWSIDSDDKEVASISDTGMLTGLKAGTVKVIAKAIDGSLKDAVKTFNVTSAVSSGGSSHHHVTVVPIYNVTQSKEYKTLEEATTAAVNGDTIRVSAGTYSVDSITIPEGVTVTGTNRNTVIIEGQNDVGKADTVVNLYGTLENITVKFDNSSFDNWNEKDVNDKKIHPKANGVKMFDNSTLENSIVTNCRNGVNTYWVAETGENMYDSKRVDNITITGNEIYQNRTGIQIPYGATGTISNNNIHDNTTMGLLFNYSNSYTIVAFAPKVINNTFKNNWNADVDNQCDSANSIDLSTNTFNEGENPTISEVWKLANHSSNNRATFFNGGTITKDTAKPFVANIVSRLAQNVEYKDINNKAAITVSGSDNKTYMKLAESEGVFNLGTISIKGSNMLAFSDGMQLKATVRDNNSVTKGLSPTNYKLGELSGTFTNGVSTIALTEEQYNSIIGADGFSGNCTIEVPVQNNSYFSIQFEVTKNNVSTLSNVLVIKNEILTT